MNPPVAQPPSILTGLLSHVDISDASNLEITLQCRNFFKLIQVAVLAGMGSVAGCIYLRLLVADVDSLVGTDGRVAPFMLSQDSQLSLKSLR